MGKNVSSDSLINWLLSSLQLETTVFHTGRYCGTWQASTAGRLMGSFHLILDGHCWLHRPGHESIRLSSRDSVLFLRDVPHHLSPEADAAIQHAPAAMQPLASTASAGGTGLACGFFEFQGALSRLLIDSLPEVLLIRADTPDSQAIVSIFELIHAEAGGDPDQPSPLLGRLVEVLLFYAIRQAVSQDMPGLNGIWSMARTNWTAGLLEDVLSDPGQDWTVEQMAERVHMSRSSFSRRFAELTQTSPAAFLTALRVRIAAQRLESGDSIERAADHVGYRSSAAFSRAFKKITGAQPGAWRRSSRHAGQNAVLQ